MLVAVLALASTAMAGCSNTVTVTSEPSLTQHPNCAAVLAAAPTYVDGAKRRAISPTTAAAAAWGRTPIVLHCGVDRPAALTSTSTLMTINGVDWFAEQLSKGYRFTTFKRTPRLQVDVPSAYHPEPLALVDLTHMVNSTTTSTAGF